MNFQLLSPREQLVAIMQRIYRAGMTTLSGGNLSILDDNDDIWITPAGIDKGKLTPNDIMRVHPDGTAEGSHRPSTELPFHRAIYRLRPDIRAIVHAHPPALVAFSIVRQVPDTRIVPQARRLCGPVGYAPYDLPGSEALGERIAGAFATGSNVVILENHGMAAVGPTLLDAFQRLETLEYCARTHLRARTLGEVRPLDDPALSLFDQADYALPEFAPAGHSSAERELRRQIVDITTRAYDRQLMISTQGIVSARLDDGSFLITPTGRDRLTLTVEDIVLVRDGRREAGKLPSRAVRLHAAIYAANADIHSIIAAQPPNVTAYAVTLTRLDTRTIPESFILLRDVARLPFELCQTDVTSVAARLSLRTPVALVANDGVLTVGHTLLAAFDRLEVAEFSARSLIDSAVLGELVPIGEAEIEGLKAAFNLS